MTTNGATDHSCVIAETPAPLHSLALVVATDTSHTASLYSQEQHSHARIAAQWLAAPGLDCSQCLRNLCFKTTCTASACSTAKGSRRAPWDPHSEADLHYSQLQCELWPWQLSSCFTQYPYAAGTAEWCAYLDCSQCLSKICLGTHQHVPNSVLMQLGQQHGGLLSQSCIIYHRKRLGSCRA